MAYDERRGYPAEGLPPEGQRRYVHEHDVGNLAREHARLDGGTTRHALHGVDAHLRLAAKEALEVFAHHRHAGGSADKDDVVDVLRRKIRILERLLQRWTAALHHRARHPLQLRAGQVRFQRHRPPSFPRHQVGQADVGRGGRGEFDLGHLRRLAQAGCGLLVNTHVQPALLPEALGQVLEQPPVHVRATELGVARGGPHLETPLAELYDGDIQGATAEVDDRDPEFLAQPVKAIGQRGAVGSLTSRTPSSPAIRQASLVALRWLSSK